MNSKEFFVKGKTCKFTRIVSRKEANIYERIECSDNICGICGEKRDQRVCFYIIIRNPKYDGPRFNNYKGPAHFSCLVCDIYGYWNADTQSNST